MSYHQQSLWRLPTIARLSIAATRPSKVYFSSESTRTKRRGHVFVKSHRTSPVKNTEGQSRTPVQIGPRFPDSSVMPFVNKLSNFDPMYKEEVDEEEENLTIKQQT